MSGKTRSWLAAGAVLALVGGIEVYVWLSGKTDSLERSEGAATVSSPLEYFPHLKAGDEVQAFVAEKVGGGTERIDYPAEGPKTYLFVLSLTCGICARTVPKWNQLAEALEGRARVIGIVLGTYQAERRLLEEKRVAFPVVRFPSRKVMEQYKVNKVPQTIVVAPGGRVESNTIGELTDDDVEDLRSRATRESDEVRS